MGQGCSQLQITSTAFPREFFQMELHEREGVCVLRFFFLVSLGSHSDISKGTFHLERKRRDYCREKLS